MKFQIGDKVLLLHSNEEGEVVDIINKKMVEVEVDGIRFPVYTDQIDFPYFKRFTEKQKPPSVVKTYIDQLQKEKPKAPIVRPEMGVYLLLFPVFDKDIFEEDIVEYFKIYIINHTKTAYTFEYKIKYADSDEFQLKNELMPGQDFYIHNLPFEHVNDSPRISVEFSLKYPDKQKAPYFESIIKIKGKQIMKRVEQLLQKQESSIDFMLMDTFPISTDKEKADWGKLTAAGFNVSVNSAKASDNVSPRSVVDLHIDKIISDWKGMSNYEILSLQLKEFEKYYDLAVHHWLPNLIVIHGVGEGVLRDEIHQILKHKKEVKSFVNQYHPNYGHGATEIYFQY